MSENRLNIVATEKPSSKSLQLQRREEAAAKFEKMWQEDPEQFNPARNAMGRERVERTWKLILEFFNPSNKYSADLGCGYGAVTQRLCQEGSHVDAVDVATIPLTRLDSAKLDNLTLIQDYLPRTRLEDDSYDLAVSTDLIAYLHTEDYRLFFSELSRVIKRTGYVVCSTPLDINSEDALQRFANLAETEFQIEKWIFSYHYLHIRLLNFLSAPSYYALAAKNPESRQDQLQKRQGFSKWWYQVNTTPMIATMWSGVSYVLKPLIKGFEQNQFILKHLENVTRFLWSDSGISHAIFIGIRRPLVEMPTEETMPEERKQKKEIWE